MNQTKQPDGADQFTHELRAAFAANRSPAFERTELHAWANAIKDVYVSGQLDIAEQAVRHLTRAFPSLQFARRMSELFDRIPPADGSQTPFTDDPSQEVQIAPRPGAEHVLLLFCGGAQRLGLPLSVAHRWLGRLPASLIYLRDLGRNRFLQGVSSLAPDLQSTSAGLRRLIASLGGRRLACYGNSGGVFPALYYGRELKAEAILCMAGRTNHTATFNAFSIQKDTTVDFASQFQHLELDGRRLFEDHPHPPRICLVYGQHNWDDRRHAEHMAPLRCVTLRPVENFAEHNTVFELVRRNEYQPLLDWLITDPG